MITYSENGEAVEMTEEYSFNYDKELFWEVDSKVTDIVWDRTDGQICNIKEIFGGNNRVKSCHIIEDDEIATDLKVEYSERSDDYRASITMTMFGLTMTEVVEYSALENNGERMYREIGYMGMVMTSISEIHYDAWGLMTLQKEEERSGGETYVEGLSGEVEYDAEGRPSIYTISEFYTDEDTGKMVSEYLVRAQYSDYVDVTAAVDIMNTDVNLTGNYYNLQGMPVSSPEKGQIVVKDKRLKIKD